LLAQTVDIAQSLSLDRARQPPWLKIRPWKFMRAKVFDATEILKRETGLQVGISYNTIYQSAPEAPITTGLPFSDDSMNSWPL
jgi:hypothetical protein